MKFSKKYFSLYFLLGSILLNNSCTFYYKTSDINESLFEFIKDVNNNYKKVNKGFKKADREYAKLKSNNEEEPFFTAKNKISSIEKDMKLIAELKKNINDEYTEFKKYSKGKSKIASNSNEWDLVKQTKKNMKFLSKEISKKGEEFVKNMESLNIYLNENIVPLVKIYKVADFKERYIKTIANLKKIRSKNLKLLNEHQLIYNNLKKTQGDSNETIFLQLEKHLSEVSKKTKELEFIKKDIEVLLKLFNEKTTGKSEIYSTDPFLIIVEEDQKVLKGKVNEIEKIKDNIKSEYSQFQKLAKTLNAE